MTRYVVGFAFSPAEKWVLLIRKERPAWQRGRLNGVGGKVEAGETPLAAMRREFREEAGADVEDWRLFAVLRGNDVTAARDGALPDVFEVWFYRATLTSTEGDQVHPATDEALTWTSVDHLPADVLSNLHWLIPMAGATSAHDWPFHVTERAAS